MELGFGILGVFVVVKLNESVLLVRGDIITTKINSTAAEGSKGILELFLVDFFRDVADKQAH